MYIVKGISIGLGIFLLISVIDLLAQLRGGGAAATGSTAITGHILEMLCSPFYWLALILTVAAACWWSRRNTISA